MPRQLSSQPPESGKTHASFSLLNTIASAQEREFLALSRAGKQAEVASGSPYPAKTSEMLLRVARRGKQLATDLMSRAKVSCTARTRQMRLVEQLAVGKATLVLVEVSGQRLLVSLQRGSSATVTPLLIDSTEAENSISGPQRAESRR